MLADEHDKLNQMALFSVGPLYNSLTLMKTLRLAELLKMCVCTLLMHGDLATEGFSFPSVCLHVIDLSLFAQTRKPQCRYYRNRF